MRRYITLLVAATVVLVLIAFLVPLTLLVRDVAQTRTLAAAGVRAQSLAPVVAAGDRATVEVALQQTASSGYPMTVLWPDGQISGTPAARDLGVRLAERGQSLTVDTFGGREILVAVVGVPGGTAVIRSFVSDRQMRSGVTRAWAILAALSAGLLAVSLVLADRLARSLVRRITRLADLAKRISRGDLEARIEPGGPPEIRDVTVGLNDLAGQIDTLLSRERESAADLSHRLRTPLTVLRLEAEALRDPEEAERVSEQVDVLERTVTDLINATRRPVRTGAPCADATAVVTERVRFWSVLADEQRRRMDLRIPPGPLEIKVRAEDLSACLDALLGNVFSHTPEGSALSVTLQPRSGAVYLTVDDAGPGFGDRHLLRRGVSTASSTGLGLDIVRRTAEASGGSLQLGVSAVGGARVKVRFGVHERDRSP
ncbi:HAMP domain-containing sensor histidine kinase [Actinomadura sp. WMMA1423]|uniref:sensor histidine kinase n=1 Tax=Actinomadura sp. WMMA1423 TaxID=2591108 RepID=UPI001146F430|nr:HAMP domain-containing sensor histidine kinase [Actinomadura sp. WMMA1423]